MGCFDDYSDTFPRAKTMRGNVITTFIFYAAQCITFRQSYFFTETIIDEASLKSFCSRLGFKVIKYLATSPNLEEVCKKLHYESGKSKALQKQIIVLQYHLTTPRRVTILRDNRIDFNENRDVFKYLNDVPPSNYWFPYEYIYAEVKNTSDETKGQLKGN